MTQCNSDNITEVYFVLDNTGDTKSDVVGVTAASRVSKCLIKMQFFVNLLI